MNLMSGRRRGAAALCVALLLFGLTACTGGSVGGNDKAAMAAPKLLACRVLTPDDIQHPSNTDPPVACTSDHTAETFAVGTFPAALSHKDDPDDPALGAYIYHQCQPRFQRFLGGDVSLVLRSTMTWAWFRPARAAWAK